MFSYLISFILDAVVIFGLAYALPQIHITSFGKALGVAVAIALLNTIIGGILRFVVNLTTLFLLSSIVKLLVTALMVKLTDKIFGGSFEVEGFWPALLVAIVLAIASYLILPLIPF